MISRGQAELHRQASDHLFLERVDPRGGRGLLLGSTDDRIIVTISPESARLELQATSGGIVMVYDRVRPRQRARVLEPGVESDAVMLGVPTAVQFKLVGDG